MRVYVDFDNTIVNTTDAFILWYNNNYNENINSDDIVDYDFNPQVKLSKKEISNAFKTHELTNFLVTYPNVYESLKKIKDLGLTLILITNCSDESVVRKIEWLDKHKEINSLFDGKIFLSVNKAYDKSCINMCEDILIDDHKENHLLSNAKYKFAYKDNPNRNWFPDNDGVKDNWLSIYEEIRKIVCQNKE